MKGKRVSQLDLDDVVVSQSTKNKKTTLLGKEEYASDIDMSVSDDNS